MDICITEESIGRVRKESLFGGRHTVTSRSGLNVTETQIIETFKGLARPENILFLENRTGASGMIAGEHVPPGTDYHTLPGFILCQQNQEKSVAQRRFVRRRLLPTLRRTEECL